MPDRSPVSRRFSALRGLLTSEAGGGLVLMAGAALALVAANGGAAPLYFGALRAPLGPLSLLHWINDGLMVLFFLLVGLEIKREVLDGQLRAWSDRALPGLAALGGMLVPALVYAACNAGSPGTLRGFAIPAATDIAFALGVLSLAGRRVPVSLKIFLTALAILDDLGAVAIIAVFYTADLSVPMLGGAALVLAGLLALNRAGVTRLLPYLGLGVLLWLFVLRSGVHATVAGVLVALAVPLRVRRGRPDEAASPLHRLAHALEPWCAYGILPLFGFANAGVSFAGMSPGILVEPVTLGVALGLFLGKQAGVFGAMRLAVALRVAQRPVGATWGQAYGAALLCGIGFTMSLFIGLLAFASRPDLEAEVKVGVLVGSLASALAGLAVLTAAARRRGP